MRSRAILILVAFLATYVTALPQSGQGVIVYVTRTGEKYHTGSCHYLRRSKISISLSDAKRRGFTACSVCKPPR